MDSRLPDLTPMTITELYQGFDMGQGALAVHQSLLQVLISTEDLTKDELIGLIASEIMRVSEDLEAIRLEIAYKADAAGELSPE